MKDLELPFLPVVCAVLSLGCVVVGLIESVVPEPTLMRYQSGTTDRYVYSNQIFTEPLEP